MILYAIYIKKRDTSVKKSPVLSARIVKAKVHTDVFAPTFFIRGKVLFLHFFV